jgi:hypothetical protein
VLVVFHDYKSNLQEVALLVDNRITIIHETKDNILNVAMGNH